jgi:large subunit ribosomal protein L10
MPTAEKTAAIEQLRGTFQKATAIFLADFTGLNVEKMTDLRRKCRESGVEFAVVKNTLAIKATRELELAELEPHLKGPTALCVSTDDPVSPARVLVDFRKENDDKPALKLGFVDGQVLTPEQVQALANLPTRDQLLSQVMQVAMAPIQNLVYALNASMSKLVRTVDAVRDGMEKGTIQSGGGAPAPAAKAAPEAPEAAPEETAEEPSGDAAEATDAPVEGDAAEDKD